MNLANCMLKGKISLIVVLKAVGRLKQSQRMFLFLLFLDLFLFKLKEKKYVLKFALYSVSITHKSRKVYFISHFRVYFCYKRKKFLRKQYLIF